MHLSGTWSILNGLIAALLFSTLTPAIELDINDEQSIKDAASTTTYGMMKWYAGNETGQIPGSFPEKWWEGSALFLALLQYWHFTGDDTYNPQLSQGLEWQSGDKGDYMPSNYSSYLGNDDQMFWGLAAMMAAELKFPDTGKFSWLSLAQGVFNTQTARWDTTACGGGLRWQIFPYQDGYTLKNSVSNGGLFQLSARLARYTNDDKYTKWAEKIWDWSTSSVLVNNKTWNVADSTEMSNNCADAGNYQWSYNYGAYLMGAAYMYNFTNGDEKWKTPVDGLLQKTLKTFFPKGIFEDITCEPTKKCNFNEILFKGLTSSWLAFTTLLVPETAALIKPKLASSAEAAAKSCTGNGNSSCGITWYQNKWDGTTGMEQEISATNVFLANMINFDTGTFAPVTAKTGGNSTSDPNAGSGNGKDGDDAREKPITTGDKAGAGILTLLFVAGWAAAMAWMVIGA
ncbi:Six-hairpin glycosidase [Penicillium bovifimosum]|uniref:Mannan endo-1,6-alpha-mannosidase n=1 Tax=Penicillium bovifimosum TaxID=126998 RepID=A0A9W9HFB2_9EURO|nr:Six-hairpin glycosidase [Penicillium bovifimosum]KAJ5145534.1 Six-hairpin glycosidase [Penicillium bovifimosum]